MVRAIQGQEREPYLQGIPLPRHAAARGPGFGPGKAEGEARSEQSGGYGLAGAAGRGGEYVIPISQRGRKLECEYDPVGFPRHMDIKLFSRGHGAAKRGEQTPGNPICLDLGQRDRRRLIISP